MSQTLQSVEWIIPTVQTMHIIAVGFVMASILMLDLRLLGRGAAHQSMAAVAKRVLPFVWWPLSVLLATGATLIVAEPSRALENPVFALKMGLLLAAVFITLLCQVPLRKNVAYWDFSAGRRRVANAVALLSLSLWVAILFAGRWIAYARVV